MPQCTKYASEVPWCTKYASEVPWCTKYASEVPWCTKYASKAQAVISASEVPWCTKYASVRCLGLAAAPVCVELCDSVALRFDHIAPVQICFTPSVFLTRSVCMLMFERLGPSLCSLVSAAAVVGLRCAKYASGECFGAPNMLQGGASMHSVCFKVCIL